ncbi:MAG: hypothetical protein KGY75_05570 [Candidatus Cloacimonetes bacterium]|nr:hypothetical protein [Candidatus Cloacimonadota bacterium]MBS3767568.1 hypothetical protein [Candidatus Cloacimonadota bacterium]
MVKKYYQILVKTITGFLRISPVICGVILTIGLFNLFIPKKLITSFFTGHKLLDGLLGASIGSIFTGNPITSYLLAGQLLESEASLFAVTAFIIAWVTVGVAQFPAEASILGKKFALQRNFISFLLSIFVSAAVVFTMSII